MAGKVLLRVMVLLSAAIPLEAHAVADDDGMALQVALDKAGFSPGVIDGSMGKLTRDAVKGFQEAHGLTPTGEMDAPTKAALGDPGAPTVTVTVSDEGPFQDAIPHDPDKQAKLDRLGYTSAVEALAERYHTTPQMLRRLNPGADFSAGSQITVPAVAAGGPANAANDWDATLVKLSVAQAQPAAAKVVVDKSDKLVRAMDADGKLIAQFPATIGSRHDPLPLGTWKIQGVSKLPSFHYNPALFWDAKSKDSKATLPPGPNNPVGVVWMDLSKEHYGIHGTPEPATIGRTTSHGCIRLTNWDAARLAQMVKPGTPAILQE